MNNLTGTPKIVLVAEDDPNDVYLIQLVAQSAAPSVAFRIVRDGEEALAYLKGEAPFEDRTLNPLPALALLDVRMPKIDGFQVLQWIRSTPEFRDLKVFVWADSEYREHVDRAKSAGADRIIKKPRALDELKDFVRKIPELISRDSAGRPEADRDSQTLIHQPRQPARNKQWKSA